MKTLCIVLLTATLASCKLFPKPKDAIPPSPILPPPASLYPRPESIVLRDVNWFVFSVKNKADIDKVLSSTPLVCTGTSGYENLAVNLQEIDSYIMRLQTLIILYEKDVDITNEYIFSARQKLTLSGDRD